jgi:sporulation protein YlmC with PRC-barrel domain
VEQRRLNPFRAGCDTKLSHGAAQSAVLDVGAYHNSHQLEVTPLKSLAKGLVVLSAGALLISAPAFAQSMAAGHPQLMTSVPTSSLTVTDWYKQPVYDQSNSKIGDINDVLVGSNGEVNAVIIGVGGFLGAGEKDVAVNFNSVKKTMKDNKTYLTLDTTKDALKNAPGFKYDSNKTSWVPVQD